jgi:hypothetical protein
LAGNVSSLDQLLYDQAQAQAQPAAGALVNACHGQVATTVASSSDDLYVVVPSVDGGAQLWGPCAWSPGGTLPSAGDDVLVIFDERETPWVMVLDPVGGSGNIDGGHPDSIYGGTDLVDGGGV